MINEFHPAQEPSRTKRNESLPAGKSASSRRRTVRVNPVLCATAEIEAKEDPASELSKPVAKSALGEETSVSDGLVPPSRQEPVDAAAETSSVTEERTLTSTIFHEAPTPMSDPNSKTQPASATDYARQPANNNDATQPTATPAGNAQTPPRLTVWQEAEAKMALIKDNRECLEWILKQQSELRLEFLNFLKKDLKEIQTVMSDVRHGAVTDEMAAETLMLIKSTYTEYWKRSFDLISPADLLGPSQRKEPPEESTR